MRAKPFTITAVSEERSTVAVRLEDHFAYTPARGCKWVQRACFWVLRKLGCYVYTDEVEIIR